MFTIKLKLKGRLNTPTHRYQPGRVAVLDAWYQGMFQQAGGDVVEVVVGDVLRVVRAKDEPTFSFQQRAARSVAEALSAFHG